MAIRSRPAFFARSLFALALIVGAGGILPPTAAEASAARATAREVRLAGAGATFPESLYKRWVVEYQKAAPTVAVDYRAIGSGGGIRAITDKTVAFAGSDAPLTKKEIEAVGGEGVLVELPMVAGGVVPAYNVPGVDQPLNFTGEVLADIFMGKIAKWNDPKLAELNPGVKLPDLAILPAYRSDGSGTTFVWTSYLATQSQTFKDRVGTGKQVKWPVGQGGQGNPSVAAIVSQTQGAIGYIEQNFATMNRIPYGAVKNAAGKFVKASPESVKVATASAFEKPREDGRLIANIWNGAGEGAYPIAGFTYIIVYRDLRNLGGEQEAKALTDYLRWSLTEGQRFASEMDYAPLDSGVREQVLGALDALTFKGQPLSKVATAPSPK